MALFVAIWLYLVQLCVVFVTYFLNVSIFNVGRLIVGLCGLVSISLFSFSASLD